MSIKAGSQLGPFEIAAQIGAGGMGEVWKGLDTRLEREVAIKVLPPGFAENPEFRARFDREAKAISSLNHPNICTLFDVGHEDGTSYLVMELIEGESLADRLTRGPLPIDQVLKYGAQIASALDCAHRRGIIHRDLKPANVMLTKAGAKLLDFGLARAGDAPPVDGFSQLLTEEAPLTAEGTILGTFQYMAPEQLEGLTADSRTDIFAFGALLYEMATGRRAFQGDTKTSLIAAIVSSQPEPISNITTATPPALDHVVRRCLEKDPDDRWQSAHDIAGELSWISQAGSQAGVATSISVRRKTREKLAWGVAAVLALGLAAGAGFWSRTRLEPPPTIRLSIPTRTAEYIKTGYGLISPDGKKILLDLQKPDDSWSLATRDLESGEVVFLEVHKQYSFLCCSPDSKEVAIVQERRLKAIDVAEGTFRDIAEIGEQWHGSASWSQDDVILVAYGLEGIFSVSALGGEMELQVAPEPERFEVATNNPMFLPDGNRFLYLAMTRDPSLERDAYKLRAGSLDSYETVAVGDVGSNVALLDSGHLLYVVDGTLTARPFDPERLEFTGRPTPITDGIDYFMTIGHAQFGAARNGTIAYRKFGHSTALAWFDSTGKQLGTLAEGKAFENLEISPDDEHVAAEIVDPRTGTANLWLYGLNRNTVTRLTDHPGDEDFPTWTPDGSAVVFTADRKELADLYIKDLHGTGEETLLLGTESFELFGDVSPDGKHLIYSKETPRGDFDLWVAPIDDSDSAVPFLAAAGFQSFPHFSADGRLVAYNSSETGRNEIWIKPFLEAGRTIQVSTEGARQSRWAKNESTLYFANQSTIYSVDLSTPVARNRPEPVSLFEVPHSIADFDVTADGRFLVVLWDDSIVEPINIILNWRPPE
jgi:hypothetical protein